MGAARPGLIRILIADDHAIVREGLKKILDEAPDMEVVAQASDSREALTAARQSRPDIVLLDISMPGRGGLDTLRELRKLTPAPRTLILSMHPEDQYAIRFLKEGADGYLSKEGAPEQLINAIRRIHAGGKYISTTLAEKLATLLDPGGARESPHESLSDRELQVMLQIADGKTVTEISEELCLSVKTISTYRSRVLQKLNLRNNAQIMRYAFQEGLVDPS